MLVVEQTLTCDVCGCEINQLTQTVPAGAAMQVVAGAQPGITQWKDVCQNCFGPLMEAFWAAKKAQDGDGR